MTTLYRFIFFDASDKAVASEDHEGDDTPEAVAAARLSLAARSHHRGVEVWRGGCCLYRFDSVPEAGSPVSG